MAKPISEDKRNMILNGNLFHAILMLAIPVMPLPKLIRIFWKGETSVIADWFSVPILPSQKVSVRLYIDWIKLLIITGIASMRIA